MSGSENWKIYNPEGKYRILVTRELPGNEWLDILITAGYRIEIYLSNHIADQQTIRDRIGRNCTAVIGQLTEKWDNTLFEALSAAKGLIYCNYAVGYDNVDLAAATSNQILVGNTPGVLTETTAEMAFALTMACSRRIVEADAYIRNGFFKGWAPDLLLGKRLWRSTLGIIGAGRIGVSYAMMMVKAFQMDLIYYSNKKNESLEKELAAYNRYLETIAEAPVSVRYAPNLEDLLKQADVISLHVPLNDASRHLISTPELTMMKTDAVLINTSRGPVLDEAALGLYCRANAEFSAGLDVFEKEPEVQDSLKKLSNVTLAPHIASATRWTRTNMAKLAALNIKGAIQGYPLWEGADIVPFLNAGPPEATPSIVNSTFYHKMYPRHKA